MKRIILKYQDFLNESLILESLNSAKTLYLQTNKIDQETFDKLVLADGTKTKKYIEKICSFYLEHKDIDKISSFINSYDSLCNRNLVSRKDINSFKTWEEFSDFVKANANNVSKSAKTKELRRDVEVILDNEKLLIVIPKTKESSVIYGSGTKWCTSAPSANYFENYNSKGVILYYIHDKTRSVDDPMWKSAVALHRKIGGKKECFDALDGIIKFQTILDTYKISPDLFEDKETLRIIGKLENDEMVTETEYINILHNFIENFDSSKFQIDSDGFWSYDVIYSYDSDLKEIPKWLKNLKKVNLLNISGCKNLKSLKGLDNIEYVGVLSFGNCENLTDISILKNKTIKSINLSQCKKLTDISAIENIKGISELYLSSCDSLTDISSLKNIFTLDRLFLYNVKNIKTLNGLDNLKSINTLYLSSCDSLTDISALKKLETVSEELNLSYCPNLKSLNGLDNLRKIGELNLSYCKKIDNLEPLKNIESANILNLSYCPNLKSLNGLDNLVKLNLLRLDGNDNTLKSMEGLSIDFKPSIIYPKGFQKIYKKYTNKYNKKV